MEWANFYTPLDHVSFDVDLAKSKGLFTETDEDDAAPDSLGGKRVPEAVGAVISSGVTLQDLHGFSSSLRQRYFGPRDLTSDGLHRSQATALVNAELGYRFHEKWRLSAEFLNLLNRRDHDIDYAYTSQITPAATPGVHERVPSGGAVAGQISSREVLLGHLNRVKLFGSGKPQYVKQLCSGSLEMSWSGVPQPARLRGFGVLRP